MAITGQQNINIGLPNESAGSDSLYTAFNKIQTNFNTLFTNASPYANFAVGNGIIASANSTTGTVTLSANLVAGNNVSLSNVAGAIIINAGAGTGNGGTITGVTAGSGLSGGGNAGTVILNLANSGVNAQSYINPTITVDNFGRITSASNNSVSGTVTSIAFSPGAGISVAGSPVTTSGTVTITNTGVTRLNPGTGILLSGSNGDITVSTSISGTVTSVALTSSTLTITGNAITTSGSIGVNLGANVPVTGTLTLSGSEDLASGSAANTQITATYFETGVSGETGTLAAGVNGLIKTFMMSADGGGDMVITVTNAAWGGAGTMTFGDVGDGCTLQYINSKWFCIGNNGVVFA